MIFQYLKNSILSASKALIVLAGAMALYYCLERLYVNEKWVNELFAALWAFAFGIPFVNLFDKGIEKCTEFITAMRNKNT
jgi:hypothetical protein